MATITVTKGQIGVEDITFMAGGATVGETFSRATSTGGSQTIHKISAKAIPVEDDGSVFTGTNVEAVLEDIQDGTDIITLNAASVMTSVKDGSANTITVPTNGMAAARFMLGNASTIAWFYLNAAPPGWKVLATGADTVLGVKATARSTGTATTDTADKLIDSGADFVTDAVVVGDVAYNTDDGTSALVTAVDDLNTLSLASDAFPDGDEAYEVGTRFIDPGGNQADEGSWTFAGIVDDHGTHKHDIATSSGNAGTFIGSPGAVVKSAGNLIVSGGGGSLDGAADETDGPDAALSHTINDIDRPAASIGRLFQLDTA